eukprot:CAMPEP_0174694928 /NCGR_PEP_ID=MMETSP1094-20130205/1402_1 /TAXON_ID=156173 /ORGANISM="Chrysochromulina brevifilum, Strain UTEX LB 985" /LENGTH=72 /DNA_ID=CAMNT_0015891291 /DNA_START=314 /DNA_END=532 /DNA_ORIENTATION=-
MACEELQPPLLCYDDVAVRVGEVEGSVEAAGSDTRASDGPAKSRRHSCLLEGKAHQAVGGDVSNNELRLDDA